MKFLLILLGLLCSTNLWAAGGYEKTSPWSAVGASLGGNMASHAQGTDALFFNPAGLHTDQTFEVQLGLSCAGASVSGPVAQSGQELSMDNETVCPFGLVGTYQVNDRLAVGFGAYALAGLALKYSNVDMSAYSPDLSGYTTTPYSNLGVLETNLSVAYKLTKSLSLGVALKGQIAQAGLAQTTMANSKNLGGMGIPDGTPMAASETELSDLEGSEWGSFTVGLQYQKKRWGLGITYRNEVKVDVSGRSGGTIAYTAAGAAAVSAATGGMVNPTPGQSYALVGSDVNVSTYIPQQVKIDTHYHLNQNNTLFVGYNWTDYSVNNQLQISGGTLTNSQTGQQIQLPNINLNWQDLHDFKLGYENRSFDGLALRAGYTYSTQVTNDDYASATFATPSEFHHVALGMGKTFDVGSENTLEVNLAVEHYFSSGDGRKVSEEIDATSETPTISGSFRTNATAAMIGATYGF